MVFQIGLARAVSFSLLLFHSEKEEKWNNWKSEVIRTIERIHVLTCLSNKTSEMSMELENLQKELRELIGNCPDKQRALITGFSSQCFTVLNHLGVPHEKDEGK